MIQKLVRYLNLIARGLEIAISVVVLFAVVAQFASLPTLFRVYVFGNDSMKSFHTFLDNILTLAIGLEFFRMICFSNADAVLEVILFVLAHHMLVSGTTALDNLLNVIGIAIVVLLNILLKYYKRKTNETKTEDEFHMLK